MNEFGQVLDRVNVVMRWRRNQANARGRAPRLCNRRKDLVSGKLTPFSRLGSLYDLDLDLLRGGDRDLDLDR